MRKPTIKTSFWELKDSDFERKSSFICFSMENNEYFPDPSPSIAILNAAQLYYNTTLINAGQKDKVAISLKNAAREKLTDLLMQLSHYIKTVATNEIMLASSGFDMAKNGTPITISKAKDVRLKDGNNAGELISKCAITKGARGYGHQYTQHPVTEQSVWIEKFSTRSKYIFKNLLSEKKYWSRIKIYGSRNQEIMSAAVCRVVQ